jgi:hypothetical protein
MLYTKTAVEYGGGTAAAFPPPIGGVERMIEKSREDRRLAAEQAVDQVLADSFPASDPPSWNPGIVQAVYVSAPLATGRSFGQRVVSFAAAIGAALLLPLSILLIGLPVAAVVRGLLELIGWAVGVELL